MTPSGNGDEPLKSIVADARRNSRVRRKIDFQLWRKEEESVSEHGSTTILEVGRGAERSR